MMDLFIADKWTAVQELFADKLRDLPVSPEVNAYVVGVLAKRRWQEDDLSHQSLVLAYQAASLSGDFSAFQRIGDWVLWVDSVMPAHVHESREVIQNLGRLSYYRCHRLMGGKWKVYEELADDLPSLVRHVRQRLV